MLGLVWFFVAAFAESPQNGDIIFHTSQSSQSIAVQKGTQSPYSHVGIIVIRKGKTKVLEASRTVRLVDLKTWIKRGKNQEYTLMRAKETLSDDQQKKMRAIGNRLYGKAYDLKFAWSDDQIYCSELVWKIYKEGAGIELIPPQNMDQYNFTDPAIKKELERRWKGSVNWKEPVVAPSDLAASPILKIVESTYSTNPKEHAK